MKKNILIFIGITFTSSLYTSSPPTLEQLTKVASTAMTEDNPQMLKPIYEIPFLTKEARNDFLLQAARYNKINILQYLLEQPEERRPDINSRDSDENTPLILSASEGYAEAVKFLIEAGANLDLQNREGLTALIAAANQERTNVIDLLLKAGADPNVQEKDGNTALLIATGAGHKDVKLLLKAGANPTLENKLGINALKMSKLANNNKAYELILKALQAKEKKRQSYEVTLNLIEAMASKGATENIERILFQKGITYDQLLVYASSKGKINTIKYLLNLPKEKQPNINALDRHRHSALDHAVINNNTSIASLLISHGAIIAGANKQSTIYLAIKNKNIPILTMLLDAHPDLVNARIKTGKVISSPLLIASHIGSPEIVKLLIQRGADPNQTVGNSPSPLFIAVSARKGEIIKTLLNLGAKALSEKEQNMLPDEQKKKYQAIRKNLKKRKRKKKSKPITRPKTLTPEEISTPEPQAADSTTIETPSAIPLTPEQIAEQELSQNTEKLWQYINKGYAKQVEQFLLSKKTFDLNTRNEQGDTLLTQAVKEAIKDKATRRLNTIQVLLRNEKTKGLTNTPNTSGKTARAIANQANKKTIVRLLAEHGAELEQKTTCPRPQPEPVVYQPEPTQPELVQLEPEQEEISHVQGLVGDALFAELSKGNKAKAKNIETIISQKPSELTRQRAMGKTPLMHAIESRVTEQILRDILNKLSREHINLEEQTKERDTALTKAIRTGKLSRIKLLINYGALIRDNDLKVAQQLHDDAQHVDDQEKANQLYENLDSLKQKKERQNANSKLLNIAAKPTTENFGPADRALEAGADINTQDIQGNTPLMRAIEASNNVIAKGLIERGAHLNTQNQNGETALILAARKNNYNLVDYLLQHNANEKIGDASNLTAYGHAQSNNYTNIANRILMHQARNDLQRTGDIRHILNRHSTLGKNKTIAVDEQTNTADKPYTGAHRDGSRTSFFPQSWNKEKIKQAIISILEKPEQLHEQPAKITEDNHVLRSALILTGTYDTVPIKVVISQTNDPHAPWKIFTAYPIK